MSWTPTDAQVEKAAWQVADWLSDRDEGPSEAHREAARAVLVAVGPHIAASALRDAAVAIPGSDTTERIDPYDRGAEWLLDRADTIEKEAGR